MSSNRAVLEVPPHAAFSFSIVPYFARSHCRYAATAWGLKSPTVILLRSVWKRLPSTPPMVESGAPQLIGMYPMMWSA